MEVRILKNGPPLLLQNTLRNQQFALHALKLAFNMGNVAFIKSYIEEGMPIMNYGNSHPIKWALQDNQPEIFGRIIKRMRLERDAGTLNLLTLFKYILHSNEDRILVFLEIMVHQYPEINENIIKRTLFQNVFQNHGSPYSQTIVGIINFLLNLIKGSLVGYVHIDIDEEDGEDDPDDVRILKTIIQSNDQRIIDIIFKRNKGDEIQKMLLIVLQLLYRVVHYTRVVDEHFTRVVGYYKLLFNKLIEKGADIELLHIQQTEREYYKLGLQLLEENRKQNESVFTFGNKVAKRNPELGQVMSNVASYLTTPAIVRNPRIGPIQDSQPARVRLPKRNVESISNFMPQTGNTQQSRGIKRKREEGGGRTRRRKLR